MRRLLFTFIVVLASTYCMAQNDEEISRLVDDGVKLHDAGKFDLAIKKYDEALRIDSINMLVLAEKSLSLLHYGKFEECISVCEYAIETNPKGYNLDMIYINYATCYDFLKQPEIAVEKYNEGIKLFPELALLHFNKGITLFGMAEYDKAIESMISSVLLDPNHAGTHNALARISHISERNIPALLAYCRFLVLEPDGKRAAINLDNLELIMAGTASKTGKKDVTINISSSLFADTSKNGEPLEDAFSDVEISLLFAAALDFDRKYRNENDVERFMRKIEMVFKMLAEVKSEKDGFFWEFYAPYFIELSQHGYIETFAYIVYSSSENSYVADWLEKHNRKVVEFYNWSNQYKWELK